jgi:hypothetical protein
VLSVLRYTASGCPFGIFKLFFSVFMYNCIHLYVIYIKSYLFPLKIWKLSKKLLNFKTKIVKLPLPNRVVNIGQDAQWNVNKHRICKICFSGNIWLWLLSQNCSSKMAPTSESKSIIYFWTQFVG